jgi:hypothetical protein
MISIRFLADFLGFLERIFADIQFEGTGLGKRNVILVWRPVPVGARD